MEPTRKTGEKPLESWKEIGAYLNRNEVTARRWEKEEGLPVHRQRHKGRSSVYAFPSEIDAWRSGRRVLPEPAPARAWWRISAAAATTLLCLVMAGNGGKPASAAGQPPKLSTRQVWSGPEVDNFGRVSMDGRYLSFTDWSTGDLAVRVLRSGNNRRLTNTGGWEQSGDEAGPSLISPDSTQAAYEWWIRKESKTELRLISLKQPKQPRTINPGISDNMAPLGWTRDGTHLVVLRRPADQTFQLGTLSLQDGSYRQLKSSGNIVRPVLSADRRWVAYGLLADPEQQVQSGVYVMPVEGGAEVRVAAEDNRPLAWSPDGSRILYLSDRTGSFSMWSVEVAEGRAAGAPALLRPDTGLIDSMGMTRTGTFYYMVRGANRSNIYSAEIGPGGKISQPALAAEHLVNNNTGASLSPDGKALAYYMVRMPQGMKVMVRSLETGKEREFLQDQPLFAPAASGPMWFPGGRDLLYVTYDFQKPGCWFYRLDVESGERRLVLNLASRPQAFKLSPDGTTLYYMDPDMHGSVRLMRRDLASGRQAEITSVKGLQPEIAVSPDGKQLAYGVQVDPATVRYLAVIPAGGGSEKEIFRGTGLVTFNSLEWSPDGKFLLFGKGAASPNGPGSLWRVPVGGGPPEPTGLSQSGIIRQPQTHPDGKRLFYSQSEPNANEIWSLENLLPAGSGK